MTGVGISGNHFTRQKERMDFLRTLAHVSTTKGNLSN